MSTESRHAQRSNATRRKLIAAARELFAARGYADVGTTEIVAAAGVTRGALYHQFADKAELLAAVVDEIDAEMTQQLASGAMASGSADPVAILTAGAAAFLEAVTRQDVHRVLLVDALPVLGWERWREIGLRHGLGLIEAVLRQGIDDGVLRDVPTRPLAHVLLAAIDEAALYVVAADDPDAARREMLEAITPLIDGLRAPAT
ncbi:MAG: TetR/AcrR family transcriptional regulator [Patulibacter sp.]